MDAGGFLSRLADYRDTGSGKTRSGITPLLYQVFQNEPRWGGLCIDDKGIYWETLSEMARHFNRQNDLILLQVRPDNAPLGWKPTHTYNLTSDSGIPYSTFAKFVVDTATSLGQQGDKGFFKSQAQTHIAHALEALYELQADVTLENAHELLLNEEELDDALEELADGYPTERRRALVEHLQHRYLNQPPEQMGGVKETIANYLHNFLTPDIAQVFCPEQEHVRFQRHRPGKDHLRGHAAEIPDRAPVREHVPEDAVLHARLAAVRPAEGNPPTDDNLLILVGRRSPTLHDLKRGRHERLQLH